MTHEPDNTDREKWSEQRVEKLLEWFFTAELPPALRANAVPMSQRSRSVVPYSGRNMAGRWLVPLCAALLIGSVVSVSQFARRDLPRVAVGQPVSALELESVSLPLLVEQVSYAGDQGVFEQRSELRWISQSDFDPRTGAWVEWSAPELVIEIEAEAVRSEQRL